MESIVGTKTSVQAHWRKNARKLLTIFLTNFHLANEMVCFFNVQENKRFKTVNFFGFYVFEDVKELLYH